MKQALLALVVIGAGCKSPTQSTEAQQETTLDPVAATKAGPEITRVAGNAGEATQEEQDFVEAYIGEDESWYVHDVFRIEWSDGTSSVFAQHLRRTSTVDPTSAAYDEDAVLRCDAELAPCSGCETCSNCNAKFDDCQRAAYDSRDIYRFDALGLTCGAVELVRFDGVGTAAPKIRRQVLVEDHCVEQYGDNRPTIGDADGDGGPEIAFELYGFTERRGANREMFTRTSLVVVDANTLNVQLRYDAIHRMRHPSFGILGRHLHRLQPREDGSPNLGIRVEGAADAPCRGANPGVVDESDVNCARERLEYDLAYNAAQDVWDGGRTIATAGEASR